MKDLSLKPYAPWFYAFEPDRRGPFCGTLLVFPTQAHVDVARTGNPALTEYVFDDLLEAGRTPVTAAIGLREDYEEYRAIRRDWIGTAIDSLVAKVDLTIKESTDRNAFPGDLFHNMIFLADKLYCIRLDIMRGIAVEAATASAEKRNGVRQEVNEIGEVRLRHALQRLRDAGEAWVFATAP